MSTRRSFLTGASALALTAHPTLRAATPRHYPLLIGTETQGKSTSKGIYLSFFDPATGKLASPDGPVPGLIAPTPAPTFLALSPSRHVLYAVNEAGLPGPDGSPGKDGMVTSFLLTGIHVEHPAGWPPSPHAPGFCGGLCILMEINHVPSGGSGPVFVSTDHTGHSVFVANYGSGSIASFLVDANGRLSGPISTFTYMAPADAPNKHSHPHRVSVSPDNRFLLVNDLGLDRIHIYALDAATAQLTPHGEWLAGPGDGPRALRFHPSGRIAYCICETQPTIHVLGWDATAPAGSQLTTLQTLRLADTPDQCHPGDIVLDARARHAYVSTRRDNTIALFAVSPDGKLTQTGKVPSGGIRPRDLTLDPTGRWLLVANQDSNNISVLPIYPKTGSIPAAAQPKNTALDQPMCLLFA